MRAMIHNTQKVTQLQMKLRDLHLKLKKEHKLKEKYGKKVADYHAKAELNEDFLRRTNNIISQYQLEYERLCELKRKQEEKEERDRNLIFEIINSCYLGMTFIELAKNADDNYGIILDDVMHHTNEFLHAGIFKISKNDKIILNPKY
jgi:hypothetical protein